MPSASGAFHRRSRWPLKPLSRNSLRARLNCGLIEPYQGGGLVLAHSRLGFPHGSCPAKDPSLVLGHARVQFFVRDALLLCPLRIIQIEVIDRELNFDLRRRKTVSELTIKEPSLLIGALLS